MTIVDAAPMWLTKLVTRVLYGKESAEAVSEAYEEVVEETGGVGGSIVDWARERARNLLIYCLALVIILLIVYMLIRKFLKK